MIFLWNLYIAAKCMKNISLKMCKNVCLENPWYKFTCLFGSIYVLKYLSNIFPYIKVHLCKNWGQSAILMIMYVAVPDFTAHEWIVCIIRIIQNLCTVQKFHLWYSYAFHILILCKNFMVVPTATYATDACYFFHQFW